MLFTFIGVCGGIVAGAAKIYYDEWKYKTDMSIPRRAGTMPLPFHIIFSPILVLPWAFVGGIMGIVGDYSLR